MKIVVIILLILGLIGLCVSSFLVILCSSKPETKLFKLYCDIFVRNEVKVWKECIANTNHFIQTYKSDDNTTYEFEGVINGKHYHITIFSLDKPNHKAGVFDENDDCIACSFCKPYSDKLIKMLLEK